MSEKYHVSADGNPHKCFASVRPCPLGGEDDHYSSMDDARAGYEASMANQTFPADGKRGYSLTTLVQTGEGTMPNGSGGQYGKLTVKQGFASPDEAIQWAKANLADSASMVSVVNDDYDPEKEEKGPDDFKSLNLIDISEERQALDTKDVPTIGKYFIKTYRESIKDEESLKLFTRRAASVLNQKELSRVRSYVKAGTFGTRKSER